MGGGYCQCLECMAYVSIVNALQVREIKVVKV
jgi:hypothetical protein